MTSAITLPPGVGDLWAQRHGESADAYGEFIDWLTGPMPRARPEDAHLAAAWDWHGRATAYDAKIRRIEVIGTVDTPHAMLRAVLTRFTEAVTDQVIKLFDQAQASSQPTMSWKDIHAFLELVSRPEFQTQSKSAKIDMSDLSADEKIKFASLLRDARKQLKE